MKKALYLLFISAILSVYSTAGGIEVVKDEELSDISAQGFNLNYQVMDDAIKSSLAFNTLPVTHTISSNAFKFSADLPTNLVDSVMVSGLAQKDAFVPINAVNSAVNVPINIIFVMNSKITGGININNQLQSALKPF